MLFQCVGDGMDHLCVGQHAEFHGMDIEVIEAGFDLRLQECDRWYVYGGDATGVLCSQRGEHGQAMHAVRGEGLEIGGDASAAAGVGAGDGEGGNRSGRAHRAIVPWSSRGR